MSAARTSAIRVVAAAAALGMMCLQWSCRGGQATTTTPSPVRADPYLRMPPRETAQLPPLLSQTGAFKDTRTLAPSDGLVPYELNVSFWSDGAAKRRWIAVPRGSAGVHFSPTGEWSFPAGTVFVKHFELDGARMETRLLVRDAAGGVYGAAYRWRADNTDADLVTDATTANVPVHTSRGVRVQTWSIPGRADCRTCHTPYAGGVLGPKARQLTGQLVSWRRLGLFENPPDDQTIARLPRLAPPTDKTSSLEHRIRSWLDANCTQCHRPGGVAGYFDARFDTPLARQNLVDGPVLINLGLDHARLIAPNDVWRSVLFSRVTSLEQLKMPPLAHNVVDQEAVRLLREWIESLPGAPVLPPPVFEPKGADFKRPIEVVIRHDVPGVVIRYTLDGTVPGKSSAIYVRPLKIDSPVTVRAAAYKDGFTRSVVAQETYVIGE